MKNVSKFIGIIAFVAVIGFSFAACSKGGGSSSSGDSGGSARVSGGGAGKLTITGLPSEGNWSVFVFPAGTDLSTLTAIANETSSISNNLREALASNPNGNVFSLMTRTADPYTGSGSRPVLLLNSLAGDATNPANPAYRTATVNFSNGNATVPLSDFTAVTSFD